MCGGFFGCAGIGAAGLGAVPGTIVVGAFGGGDRDFCVLFRCFLRHCREINDCSSAVHQLVIWNSTFKKKKQVIWIMFCYPSESYPRLILYRLLILNVRNLTIANRTAFYDNISDVRMTNLVIKHDNFVLKSVFCQKTTVRVN